MARSWSPLLLIVALAGCAGRAPVEMTFDRFHDVQDVSRWFDELARRHPRWFRVEIMGRSVQGRPLPCLTITDHDAPGPKAGYWIDGAIHGGEVGSQEPPLGVVRRLQESVSAGAAPSWLGRVTLHVAPILNPDGLALALRPPFPSQRRNLQPVDDDGDGRVDEDGPEDLNGDGRIGPMYRGGRYVGLECRDQDGDGEHGEDPPGGFDLNRNFPLPALVLAGTSFPAHQPEVQPETQAVMDFWRRHPGIRLAVSHHTSANVLVRPDPVEPELEGMLQAVGDRYAAHIVDRPPARWSLSSPRQRGTTMEWFLRAHHAVAVTVELEALPDGPRTERELGTEDLDLGDRGMVQVQRWSGRLGQAGSGDILADLPRLVDRHVGFLLSLVDLIDPE